MKGRVFVDAHARLRRARTRRALVVLSEEALDVEHTAGDLERRLHCGATLRTLLPKEREALRTRLRREALRALAVTHAFKHAVRAPCPEPDRDSDDEAVAAARAEAHDAYVAARERDDARVRRVLRRFRAEAAAEALQHWDTIIEELKSIEVLNARTCDYAARIVGSEARIERRRYGLTLFENEQDDEGDELPGISDLLCIAEAHRTEASRVVLAMTACYEGEMKQNGFPVLDAVASRAESPEWRVAQNAESRRVVSRSLTC